MTGKKPTAEDIARSQAASIMGKKGGKARLTKMTPEERSRIAGLGAQARWGERKKRKDLNK